MRYSNWSSRCAIVGLAISASMVAGCSSTERASADKVPASVTDAGEYGENIYDAAKGGDWTTAAKKLDSLKNAANQIAADIPSMNAEQKTGKSRLSSDIAALQKSVPTKDSQATIERANDVTLIANQLAAPFGPAVPP